MEKILPLIGLFLSFLSIASSILVTAFLFISNKSSRSQEKQEDNATKLILAEIKLSETRMMGKLDSLTSGQAKMEKDIKEIEIELTKRKEEASEKAKSISDLEKQVRSNEEWIEELRGRYKNIEQAIGLKNVTDVISKK